MTPIGHFSILSETEHNKSICTFFMQLEGDEPLSKDRLMQLWNQRQMMELHPRFHMTACTRWPGYFRNEASDAEHFTESLYPISTSTFRSDIMHRLRYLQTTPWDLSQSLWHAWIAPNTERQSIVSSPSTKENTRGKTLLLFRSHHVLADGASMGAALMDLFDEVEELREAIKTQIKRHRKKVQSLLERIQRKLRLLYWFVAGSCQAFLYQLHCLFASVWSNDPWSRIRDAYGSDTSNLRTVSWIGPVAPVEQVKWIAQQLGGPQCTVNDVFVSCVTAALAKQLEFHRKRMAIISNNEETALPKQEYMNVTVPVHLTGGVILPGESVGNSLGAFVARVPLEGITSDSRILAVHRELNFLKRTPAAIVSHVMATSLSYAAYVLPPTLTSWLYRKASAGSLAVVTNVRMSPEATHIDGRRVESVYGFVPLPPGLPVGVVVASYAGNMYLTVTSEPWAIPDGDEFLRLVLQEYLRLFELASRS